MLRLTVINWNEKHTGLRVCVQEIQTLLPFCAIKVLTPPCASPSVYELPALGTPQLAKGLRKGLLWIHFICESQAINSLDLIKEK